MILKIMIISIIFIINKINVVNNMTKPLVADSIEIIKQPIKTDVIESQKLLGPTGKVEIQHRGEIYQLRQTRTGKLILTK